MQGYLFWSGDLPRGASSESEMPRILLKIWQGWSIVMVSQSHYEDDVSGLRGWNLKDTSNRGLEILKNRAVNREQR